MLSLGFDVDPAVKFYSVVTPLPQADASFWSGTYPLGLVCDFKKRERSFVSSIEITTLPELTFRSKVDEERQRG